MCARWGRGIRSVTHTHPKKVNRKEIKEEKRNKIEKIDENDCVEFTKKSKQMSFLGVTLSIHFFFQIPHLP